MATLSPRKSTRAAATRRKAPIIDDDSDGEENHAPVEQQDEEDFTPEPAPKKTVRRGRPRKGADEDATPKTTSRRRTHMKESVEPTQLFSPPETSADPAEPLSPRKSASPKKRTSAKTSRKSRVSVAVSVQEEEDTQLPTPKPSASPEPTTLNAPGTPLADITESAINERASAPPTEETMVEKINAMDTVLEKPMDIVVRKRAAALPITQEPIEGKPRLIITYLVLTNFKSYAGRQEVGPFHTSFSAVVGPNGSGKSNVIDSLLFVFGFRASKMRQGKLSALIHNSAGHPDLDHCEVEVQFQEIIDLPSGGHEVVPDSTLIVSRKAFKNNASKYYINSRESTFTVVTNLLRDKGIDLDHKRFLILQGEVESIAQMKPKAANEHDDGLLEYLEDIIGTSKYKAPIEESATAVEELNEECLAKSNHVQIIEKEKNSLEDKKNKALAYIRDQNELAAKQATLYQMEISRLNDKIDVSQEKVANMEGQLNEELEKHRGNEEEIKQLDKQYKKGAKDYDRLEKQTQAVLSEVARIDSATVKFDERKKFLNGRRKKFEKEKETSKMGISSAETQVEQYRDDVERFAAEIEELEKDLEVEEKEFEKIAKSIAPKTEGLSKQRDEKQASLAPWKEKVSEEQRAIAVFQQERDLLREKENSGAKGIADVEEKIAGLEETKEEKVAELEQCKLEKNSVEKQVSKKHTQIADLTKREPVLASKLSGVRQKADEARASLSATQTQGNVLKGLMRLKESGRINGFHGRLGNLGTIEQAYDVAISTACPQLENIVVDTVEVGQQCIDYLRKNNLGRANFILLNRLAQRDLSQIDTPENVPRLFDLVKPKHDKFRPAFFSVLQNTLVAKDLEQANRIAYGAKRWRVVTLDGQLIDKSGTMTGGGTRVAKGGMSSKLAADVTQDQVVKLEHDRDSVEQEFVQFQEEQRDLEASLRELNERIPQLETKAQKIALELESFDRNIADFQHRISELSAEQTKAKTNQGRISELEKMITTSEKKIAKLRGETAGIEEEIKVLDDKIGEIGGVKLRTQRAKVTDLKQQLGSRSDAKSNAEGQQIQARNQHTKHEKAHSNATRELEKTAAELEKADEDMQTHKRDAAGRKQEAEEAQEALEARRDELDALKKELDEKTAELNETRAEEIKLRAKLEEDQKDLQDYQKKQKYYEEKWGKLKFNNLSDLGEEQESQGLPTYSKDELRDMDKDQLKQEIDELEAKNENTTVDTSVLEEYRKRVEAHATRSAALAEVVGRRDTAKKRCDEFRRLRLEGFMEGFSIISLRLKEMYQLITMGGNAELELVDSLDPFSEGILFSVMPPKKSWKNISNLSGGEKTLSSLALVFALHSYKPTPLYVMDEIDAALDFKNISIVASYIKSRTKNAQFIVISLRNNMFELSSRLVGIYKVNHMTKSVTIENKDYLTSRA